MFGIGKKKKDISENIYEKLHDLEERNQQLEEELAITKKYTSTCLKEFIEYEGKINYDLFDNYINQKKLKSIDIIATMEFLEHEDELPVIWYGVKVIGNSESGETMEISKIPVDVNADGCINSKFANFRRQNTFELARFIANYILLEFKRGLSRSCVNCEFNIIENKIDSLL